MSLDYLNGLFLKNLMVCFSNNYLTYWPSLTVTNIIGTKVNEKILTNNQIK